MHDNENITCTSKHKDEKNANKYIQDFTVLHTKSLWLDVKANKSFVAT